MGPAQAALKPDAFHDQMLRGTNAKRAEIELARIGACMGQQLFKALPGRIRPHHQAHDEAGDLQNVSQIIDRIIRRAGIDQHLPHHTDMHLRNRIAIGPRLLQRHGAQNA